MSYFEYELIRLKLQAALANLSFAKGVRYETGVTEDGDFKVMFISRSKNGVTFERTFVYKHKESSTLPFVTRIGHVINTLLIETIKG
jgi:hypothetical protein